MCMCMENNETETMSGFHQTWRRHVSFEILSDPVHNFAQVATRKCSTDKSTNGDCRTGAPPSVRNICKHILSVEICIRFSFLPFFSAMRPNEYVKRKQFRHTPLTCLYSSRRVGYSGGAQARSTNERYKSDFMQNCTNIVQFLWICIWFVISFVLVTGPG